MLTDSKAFSSFAVDDLAAAKQFYGETLGLRVSEIPEMPAGLLSLHLAGDRDTMIYEKPDFVPATYTVLNFPVSDIEAAVDELAGRGVRFERYEGVEGIGADMDDTGIHRGEGPLIAWFTDPAGNVLAVIQTD